VQAGSGGVGAIVQRIMLPDLACDFVAQCQLPALFSTSVKLTRSKVSRDRWLLTLPHSHYDAPQMRVIEHKARAFLNMRNTDGLNSTPLTQDDVIAGSMKALSARQFAQTCLHLGYVKEGAQDIRKLYYEYDLAGDPTVFIALKSKMGCLDIHRYDLGDPNELATKILRDPDIKSMIRDILRVADRPLSALHVQSVTTTRQSLDLNLSDVNFTPALQSAIYKLLVTIHPGVHSNIAETYQRPTHIAIGHNEEGQYFVTLYGAAYWIQPGRMTGQKA
jgi:hypothetical protein